MSCGAGLAFTFTLVPLFLFRAARPRSCAIRIPRSKAGRIFLIIPRDRPNFSGGPGPLGPGPSDALGSESNFPFTWFSGVRDSFPRAVSIRLVLVWFALERVIARLESGLGRRRHHVHFRT